ncbi:toast rack family protein, partial [Methanoregula sp.]|uniref:toast rack family protein n=1 Tax=Methanoregula sp. TaxID=2052170 RepID=UPI000CBA1D50
MKPERSGDKDILAVCAASLSGLTMTRVILWLIAITIVSYAFGFAIFALSGGLSPGPEPVASPFNRMAFTSANTSSFPLEGASSGDVRIILGAGELTVQGGAQPDILVETTVYSGSPMMQPDYAVSRSGSPQRV